MIVGVSVNDESDKVRLTVVDHDGEATVELKPEYAKNLAARILVTAFGLEDKPNMSQL